MHTAQKVPTIDDLYDLGRAIGAILASLYFNGGDLGVEWKKNGTAVTNADRTIFQSIGEWRDNRFPGLPIVSEEGHSGERTGDPDQYWFLVDEVDGTEAYRLRMPVFTSLLALMRGSKVMATVIVDPISRRIFSAERGKGAFCNRKPIRVSEPDAIPSVGIVAWPNRDVGDNMLIARMKSGPGGGVAGALHGLGCLVPDAITIGYFDALVALGSFSGTIFPGATLHDTAAGHLLVEEAGGVATDLRGDPLSYGGNAVFGHIFACNPRFHSVLLRQVEDSMTSQ